MKKSREDKDMFLYRLMSMIIEEKLKRNAEKYQTRFPHVSRNYEYEPMDNCLWTAAFFPGMMYLAYDLTGDGEFLKHSEGYLKSFEERLDKKVRLTHDLGFLYTLSCVACFRLTGNSQAKALAERAADILAERFCEKGNYIQAWGEFGKGNPYVQMIIDTMMNLPLLYWSGTEKNKDIAKRHAKTCETYIIRKDYSSYHTYWMNPETGEAVRGATHQGFADESTWARGQAWAVYGFALSYRYTKEPSFLTTAQNAAEVFLKSLPDTWIPYWDFSFSAQVPDVRDTSSAAICICGLLELKEWVDSETANKYERAACAMIRSLFDYEFDHNPDSLGVLREGMYHRDDGAEEYTSWGDYFFFEALVRMQKKWVPYW